MSPKRSSLTLLILFSFIPSSLAITCESCIGEDECTECKGDYCMLSSYMPRFGNSSLLKERKQIKGCIYGEMIAKNIKSMCIGDKGDEKMCICNKDNCNFGTIKQREETKKVTCKCNTGKNCNKGQCEGDLCFWSRDARKTNQVKKGCMTLSIPLFERRLINSCMLPPMTGSLHYIPFTNEISPEDILNTESCLCSTKNCNNKKPFEIPDDEVKGIETQKCDASVKLELKGSKIYRSKNTTCYGEFCYLTKIAGEEIGQLVEYVAAGCATFASDKEIDEEFSGKLVKGRQCGEFNGGGVKVRTCLMTKDKEAVERLMESAKSSKKENEDNDYENNNREDSDEDEEGEEEEEETTKDKGKDGRSNGKKKEDKEEDKKEEEIEEEETKEEEGEGENKKTAKEGVEQKDIGEGVKIVPTTKNFVFIAPTESPALDESNATMITVFVLIILCICVAGVTWKFQLHRKLMRGNYDTVAGG